MSAAAAKAKASRDAAYSRRSTQDKDGAALVEAQAFARAWDSALEVATDALEAEARRRAIQGVSEPVGWYQGKPGGKVRRYSDTLLIFLLKAHRPEKFRETISQQHSGEIVVQDMEAVRKRRWAGIAPALAMAQAESESDESAADG